MAQERMFIIEEDSRFSITLTEVHNVEDVVDVFYTVEELQEMLGEDTHFYGGKFPRRSLIIGELTALKNEMVANNRRSMIIKDDELVEFLKSGTHYSTSDFVKGLRRVGNRLFLHENVAKEKQLSKKSAGEFISVACRVIDKTLKCTFNLTYVHQDYYGAAELVKKLTTVDEVVKFCETSDHYRPYIDVFKMIWNDTQELKEFNE